MARKHGAYGVAAAAIVSICSCQVALALTRWDQYSQAAEKAYVNKDFGEAEKNFLEALKEAEIFPKSDKRLATTVYNLGLIYQQEEKYSEAEQTYRRALELFSGIYGADHERTAQVHIDLGDLYRSRSEAQDDKKSEWREQAADEYKLAIEILSRVYEKSKTPRPPVVTKIKDRGVPVEPVKPPISHKEAAELLIKTLNNFADFFTDEDEFASAQPLYQRAIDVGCGELGPESRKVAQDKARFADFYCMQGKYQEAEPLFKDAIMIMEKVSGPESLELAKVQYNAGGLYCDQHAFARAEELFARALKIFEKDVSMKSSDFALKSISLANVFDMQGKTVDAHLVYQKSIATLEKDDNPSALLTALKQYHKHLMMINDKAEAAKVSAKIKELKTGAP